MHKYGHGKACGKRSGTLIRPKVRPTGVKVPGKESTSRDKLDSGGKSEIAKPSR